MFTWIKQMLLFTLINKIILEIYYNYKDIVLNKCFVKTSEIRLLDNSNYCITDANKQYICKKNII
jgi:hypothetical protein